MTWPATREQLVAAQRDIEEALPPADFAPAPAACAELSVAGCFVAFPRQHVGPGSAGDPAWAGAALCRGPRLLAVRSLSGTASAGYAAGLLALREGPVLEAVVRLLPSPFDVLLVNATGLDHPRGVGLAVHLGAVLGVPTIGVTHRPLLARGEPPADGSPTAALRLRHRTVALWVVTRPGARPVVVHAGWRTSAESAADVVRAVTARSRTPEPLRQARRAARTRRTEWAKAV